MMAPFRRDNSSSRRTEATEEESNGDFGPDTPNGKSGSVWDRRRKRLEKKKTAKQGSSSKRKEDPEELDPYDSDPGESYRERVARANGIGNKSCVAMPRFLSKNNKVKAAESSTVLTAPPSPMQSDMGDMFGSIPASLPTNLTRVRYSLRSSITDGAEKQPMGPSVMERRELRPNNVHLNVSHWSAEGGRPYMEDR